MGQTEVRDLLKPYMLNSIPKNFLEEFNDNEFYVNPTGNFVIGGPDGDCGLTGRKIIVDTYGGAAPPYVSTIIFLPVKPLSPSGPPITKLPVGFM